MRTALLVRAFLVATLAVAACVPPDDVTVDDDLPETEDLAAGKEDGLTRPIGTYRPTGAGADFGLVVLMTDKTFVVKRGSRTSSDRGTAKYTTGGSTRYVRFLTSAGTDLGRWAYRVETGQLQLRSGGSMTWQPYAHAAEPACGAAADCGKQGVADAGCTAAWSCSASTCSRSCPAVPAQDWSRDVLSTSLAVNVTTRAATATIALAGSPRTSASFDVRGLTVKSVQGATGVALPYQVTGGRLDVGVPASTGPAEVKVAYTYRAQANFDGALANGSTFVWPYFCGNLFPCKPDPSDGLRLGLSLTGVPAGKRAVFPASIAADAPPYMLAWAVGDYTYRELGRTAAGTKVGVWSQPSTTAAQLSQGTSLLVKSFEWLEQHVGAYTFGADVASVDVSWGNGGSYGGMEHHPFWHVSHGAMNDRVTHVHEAAHGWFGDGVRIACWEDFVLSEGTVTYLAARALAATGGAQVEREVWAGYASALDDAVATEDTIAWPQSCGAIDVLTSGLYSNVPYMKGAHFYRAVEQAVGAAALDRAIARFYREHVGKPARMQQMLDTIKAETRFDPAPLARAWLQSRGRP